MSSGYLLDTLGGWKACCDGCAKQMMRHHAEGTYPLSRVDFSPYGQNCLFCGHEIAKAIEPFRAEFTDAVRRWVKSNESGTRSRATA